MLLLLLLLLPCFVCTMLLVCSLSVCNALRRYMRSEEITFDTKWEGKAKDRKEINVRLKSGSFGDVYAAVHCQGENSGTAVAVKRLRSPGSAQELAATAAARAFFAAFVAEVSLAFCLNHPNIVRTLGGVVDTEYEPPCWIVMERLEQSLAEVPCCVCCRACHCRRRF